MADGKHKTRFGLKTHNTKNKHNSNYLAPGLYLVAVPIGNLEDLTLRAKNVMEQADLILAEDTRVAQELFREAQIKVKGTLKSYHNFNENESAGEIVDEALKRDLAVALISDAGTPSISDPGTRIVREAHKMKIRVSPVPGASSLTSALSVSGLGASQFYFGGFLPENRKERKKILKTKATVADTLVFFETPHRLVEALEDMEDVFGSEREFCLCRELTKTYETVWLTTVREALLHFKVNPPKGECVLVVKGQQEEKLNVEELKEQVSVFLNQNMSHTEILEQLLPVSDRPRKELYKLITEIKSKIKKV